MMYENVAKEPPDPELKRCYDCCFMKGAVSWWCTNEEAIAVRGTLIPDVCKCRFWEPAKYRPNKSLWERLGRWFRFWEV